MFSKFEVRTFEFATHGALDSPTAMQPKTQPITQIHFHFIKIE